MSQLRPLHDRIIAKRLSGAETTPGGLIIPTMAKEKPHRAEVVAVGPGRYSVQTGNLIPMTVVAGDRIMFGKFAGDTIVLDDEEFLILREEDVLAVIGNDS